jgi:hypothetical protein
MLAIGACAEGCTQERPPPPRMVTVENGDRTPRVSVVESATRLEGNTVYRSRVGPGAELYLGASFQPRFGGYDLMFHFHGVGKLQEANVERAGLNVAVVSVNLGAGTDPYEAAFRSSEQFERLLADTQADIERSGRAPGAKMRRLAFSAWSAGFVSISRIMNDPNVARRVDAILLADGFFTNFINVQKRTVNPQGLERFVRVVDAATKDQKLFAITHTTIPTGPYPSVQECVAKLLDMSSLAKNPSTAIGPRNMHEIYSVDRGSFHVHGYEGTLAKDHVNQLRAMGETLYPYLKKRWDEQDEKLAAAQRQSNGHPRSSP